MAKVNIISVSGDNFVNIGTENIISLIVANTHSADIEFDLIIGPKLLENKNGTTDAIFILNKIPVPQGSTFVWDDDGVLSNIFNAGSVISKFDAIKKRFTPLNNYSFMIRVQSSEVADVIIKRR